MEFDYRKPTAITFWILWFAILCGLLILTFVVGGGFPAGENQGKPPALMLAMAAVLAVFALAIRFFVIPKTKEMGKLLPLMMVGLLFSEGIGIIGVFVVGKEFPETRQALFVASVSAVLAYAPFYVHAALDKRRMR